VVRELDGLKEQRSFGRLDQPTGMHRNPSGGGNRSWRAAPWTLTAQHARGVIEILRRSLAPAGSDTPLTLCGRSFMVGLTDAEAQAFVPRGGGNGPPAMGADSAILGAALACKARVCPGSGACLAAAGAPQSQPQSQVVDEVYLATSDKNLQVLARLHGVAAGSMAELRGELTAREAVWRKAYASAAIEQATCMGGEASRRG